MRCWHCGRSFRWKDRDEQPFSPGDTGHREFGLVAQELEQILPELVHESNIGPESDDADANPEHFFKFANYIGLVAPLIALCQRQQKQINSYESRLSALESK
jgi:hypothetical protein